MHFILGVIVCLLFGFLFYFVGHVILKRLNILNEENQLLSNLLKICLGTSGFLIVINFFSNILKDFNWGLIISFVIICGIIIWQLNEFKQTLINLITFFKKDNFQNFFKSHTDKYFWILFGVINFVYGITAFSTVKLDRFTPGSGHVYNVNQLLIGNYPLKYSFLPNVPQKYHYGSDILGALVSKFSGLHPEISLDILTLVFLNLSLLTLYALTVKFLNTNPVNKYLVPFIAFLGWGPITFLFKTNPGEVIPANFLEKVQYLTQTRLIDAANWSGLVLHWFFAPPAMIGIFFLLISLYLIFNFLNNKNTTTSILFLSLFLSSLEIIDITKFVVIIIALAVYVITTLPLPIFEDIKDTDKTNLTYLSKSFGLLFLSLFIFCFIHGNWFTVDKNFMSLLSFYKPGTSNLPAAFSPLKVNFILLAIFAFGFYQAYKQKDKWLTFLLTYFLTSMILPFFLTIPSAGIGKLFMTGNVLGAFSLPFAVDFIKNKLNLKEEKIKIFYALIFILLSFSTLMYWAFGDREKPLFKAQTNNLQFAGWQVFPVSGEPEANPFSEEYPFIQYLRSQNTKDQTIVAESNYAKTFSAHARLNNLLSIEGINTTEYPIRKEAIPQNENNFRTSFSLDNKFWKEYNIRWLYLTPMVFRQAILPQAKMRLLNGYLNGGVKLALSNRADNLFNLKELYKIDPKILGSKPKKSNTKTFTKLLNNKIKTPAYIQQIAKCPYSGIYNAMSSDFDGDMIADIAFFDESKRDWFIIYGKNNETIKIDLKRDLLLNIPESDLLIPIPSDYDGDSKTDIALFNNKSKLWYVLRSSDSKVATAREGCIDFGEVPVPADLDGDLKTDISCYGSPSNNWAALITSTNFGYQAKRLDSTPIDIALLADIDGDKKADNVVYRLTQQRFYLYLTSKANNIPFQINLGEPNSRIILDDYDGDKKFDLSTWNPDNGKWEIVFAKDILQAIGQTANDNPPVSGLGCGIARNPINGIVDITSCKSFTFTLGESGDIPMPGDYNGDGKSDIAIFHIRTLELESVSLEGIHKKIDLSRFRNFVPASIIGI